MLKKTIKYTDFEDNVREEVFHFNISRAELAMMENSEVGGFRKKLERIVNAQDNVAIMEVLRDIIHKSVGEVSPDGRRFMKSEEIARAFEETEAYSELIVELLGDEEKAAEFINAIMPKEIVAQAAQLADSDIKILRESAT